MLQKLKEKYRAKRAALREKGRVNRAALRAHFTGKGASERIAILLCSIVLEAVRFAVLLLGSMLLWSLVFGVVRQDVASYFLSELAHWIAADPTNEVAAVSAAMKGIIYFAKLASAFGLAMAVGSALSRICDEAPGTNAIGKVKQG